jgi:hypothetical protein
LLVFSFSACDQEDEDFSEEAYYDGEEYLDDEGYLDDEQQQYDAQEENPEQEPLTYNDEPSDQGEGDGYWWGYDYEDEFYGDESADIISEDNTDIDWPSVQAVSSHQEAAQYFKECMDARMTTIPVRLTNGYDISIKDFLVITSAPYVSENIYSNDGNEICLTYDILYFPGTRIADAYLSKDTSGLNSDELQVYNIALQIVEEAEQMPSDIHKELILHDRICEAENIIMAPVKWIYRVIVQPWAFSWMERQIARDTQMRSICLVLWLAFMWRSKQALRIKHSMYGI